ncbi:hypothetical protein GGR55DRAFT_163981 [Xylaria sp. FL0064]|nr:hypothetical protein GGR55DRAFT_163981 [Xylaria sp. FL0064]
MSTCCNNCACTAYNLFVSEREDLYQFSTFSLYRSSLGNDQFSFSMASSAILTTLSTSTSTEDRAMATLFIANTPCSDIRLSSCESLESCVVQILPSALCFDDILFTWTFESTLSCAVTSTPLAIPAVTFPQNDCPLGMTMAKSAIQSNSGWCCPLGFKWASHSLCQSSIIPGMLPQLSDACALEKTFAFTSSTTPPLKRAMDTPSRHGASLSLTDELASSISSTSVIGPRAATKSAVTLIYAEAIYIAGQPFPTDALDGPDSSAPGASSSASGVAYNEGKPAHGLSDLAKVALGLGSGVVGSILILLAVFLIRRYRKRRLCETAKDEINANPNLDGYIRVEPKSPSSANFDLAKIHNKPEAVSPRELVDELIYTYFPKPERPKEKAKTREVLAGERARSEASSFGGTTFFSMNHFELEAEIQPSESEETGKQKNRASSQVLPWQSGIYDQWILDPCTSKQPEAVEREFI